MTSPPYALLDAADPSTHVPVWRRRLVLFAAAAVLAATAFVLFAAQPGGSKHGDLGALVGAATAAVQEAQHAHPMATMSATIGLYALWIVLFLPTTLPELAMGFTFGLGTGYMVDLGGKLIGAFASYALGRTVLRSCVHDLLRGNPAADLLAAFEHTARSKPYTTSLILRAAYLPMPLKNYGLAMLGVPLAPFALALLPLECATAPLEPGSTAPTGRSSAANVPLARYLHVRPSRTRLVDTYLPVAIGASANDLAALMRGDLPASSRSHAWAQLALVGVAALGTLALLAAIAAVARRAIDEGRRERQEEQETDVEEK